jgi:hypothetical protein
MLIFLHSVGGGESRLAFGLKAVTAFHKVGLFFDEIKRKCS